MHIGDIKKGKVISIFNTHLLVEFPDNWKGLLHVSKISDYYVPSINTIFTEGKNYYFEVINMDETKKRVKLSWKSIMPRFVKDPYDFSLEETENGFKNLYKKTIKGVKND